MFLRTLFGPLASRLPALLLALLAPLQAAALPQVSFYTYPGYVHAGQTTVIGINLSDDTYQLVNASISLWDFSASGFQATGANISNGCGGSLSFPSTTSLSISGVNWPYISPPCTVSFEVTYVGTGPSATVTFAPGLLLNPGSGTNLLPASTTICIIPSTVVTTTADSGAGSLRAAIGTMNANACAGQYDIDFNITSSPPPWKIALASDLPPLAPAPGSQVNFNLNNAATGSPPSVVLDGSACARGCSVGLATNESVQVYNLAAGGFKTAGVQVASGYTNLYDSYLGTDASGTKRNGNGVGLDVLAGAGYGSFHNGVIIWNGIGVRSAGGSANVSQAGIGVDVNGNLAGNGIGVLASAGSANVSSSTLRGNAGAGMALIGTANGTLGRTPAYGNGGPALDLNNDGVTPNDGVDPGPYDTDTGPNGLQNYPVFTALYDGVNTVVTGVLKTQPGYYEVALFENSVPRTVATGGEFLRDSQRVSTDTNGVANFSFTLAGLHDNLSMQASLCPEGCGYSPSEFSPSVKTQLPGPGVGLTPRALDFGSRSVGTRSPSQSVVLLNNGTVDLTVRNITINGDYGFSSSCPITRPLAPGESCAIDVAFAPLIEGPRTGTLTVETGDSGSPRIVSLTGMGIILAIGTLSIDTPPLDFGALNVDMTSPLQLVHVTNTGNERLAISWSVTGPFAVVDAPANVVACGSSLAPGESCNVAVVFMPVIVGGVGGNLVFVTDGSNPTAVEPLSGQGISGPPPRALAVPGTLDFGSQAFGIRSAPLALVLTNTTGLAITVSDVVVVGDFSVGDGCAVVPAHGSCSVNLYFLPTARGGRNGVATITVAGDTRPYVVSLVGDGGPNPLPVLNASPSRIGFGNALVGPAGPQKRITLSNGGELPVLLGNLVSPGDFLVTSHCPGTIPVGGSCTLDVVFYPRLTGFRAETLQVPSNAGNSPARVDLSGTGCALPNAARARLASLVCSP